MATTTQRVRIGTFTRSAPNEAVGVLWGPPGGHDSTFNGKSVAEIKAQFRATRPTANMQFDEGTDGYVYLVTQTPYDIAYYTAGEGMTLTGAKVTGWTAGGILLSSPAMTAPSFLASDPNFNGLPAIVFDNTGSEQSLVANAIAAAMDGRTAFTITYVGSTQDVPGSGFFYTTDGVEIALFPNDGGSVHATWNGTSTSAAVPVASDRAQRIDLVATGSGLRIYFNAVQIASGIQQVALTGTLAKVGYDGVRGYTGHLAELGFSNNALSQDQITQLYRTNTKAKYGP